MKLVSKKNSNSNVKAEESFLDAAQRVAEKGYNSDANLGRPVI